MRLVLIGKLGSRTPQEVDLWLFVATGCVECHHLRESEDGTGCHWGHIDVAEGYGLLMALLDSRLAGGVCVCGSTVVVGTTPCDEFGWLATAAVPGLHTRRVRCRLASW